MKNYLKFLAFITTFLLLTLYSMVSTSSMLYTFTVRGIEFQIFMPLLIVYVIVSILGGYIMTRKTGNRRVTFFTMPHLMQPNFKNAFQLHFAYIIKDKEDGKEYRVRCTSKSNGIYYLNIINEDDSPTDNWIKMNHEDYNDYFELIDAITAKEQLKKLQEDLDLVDVKL